LTPQPRYSWGNKPQYPLNSRLGGFQGQSGGLEKKKSLDPAYNATPDFTVHSKKVHNSSRALSKI